MWKSGKLEITEFRKPRKVTGSQMAATPGTNEKDPQIYVSSYPVTTRSEAEVLSKRDVWDVLNYLHRKGPKGATADEISSRLGISRSVTYATLRDLHRFEIISVYSREEGRKKIRKKAYACRTNTWGQCRADVHFADAMRMSGELEQMNRELVGPLLQALDDVYVHFSSRRELKPFLPSNDLEGICPKCHRNHEAVEFFCTIILLAVQGLVSESEEFEKFLVERRFAGNPPANTGSQSDF